MSGWAWGLFGVGGALGICYASSRVRRQKTLGLAPPAPRRKHNLIFDPWTPLERRKRIAREFLDVRAGTVKQVVPDRLPRHIRGFAEFMIRQSKRPLTGRDIVKAYLITAGSMRRQAISVEKVRERWPDFPGPRTGDVRPEDVLSELLQSPVGQRYLNAASHGTLDKRAAKTIATRYGVYGLGNVFAHQLTVAPNLAKNARQIDQLIKQQRGKRHQWYGYVQDNFWGIDVGKAGFLASLLGRGDIATADAREIKFWLCPLHKWNRVRGDCEIPLKERFDPGDLVDEGFVEILTQKMRALKMKMPIKYTPFREHLTHHAVWDAVENSATTHSEIVTMMEDF